MTRGPSGGWVDHERTRYLIDPSTPTSLTGDVLWTETEGTTVLGTVSVDAPAGEWDDLKVRVHLTPLRPERIFVAYTCKAGWIRRLCVNQEHRPFKGTHKHSIVAAAEGAYEPDDIPSVPIQPDVPPEHYEAVFRAFVAECSIVVPSSFNWTSPWEGA